MLSAIENEMKGGGGLPAFSFLIAEFTCSKVEGKEPCANVSRRVEEMSAEKIAFPAYLYTLWRDERKREKGEGERERKKTRLSFFFASSTGNVLEKIENIADDDDDEDDEVFASNLSGEN